jgi:hypothetical protein
MTDNFINELAKKTKTNSYKISAWRDEFIFDCDKLRNMEYTHHKCSECGSLIPNQLRR